MNSINNLLNRTNLYKLTLYYLSALLVIAIILSYFHVLAFSPFSLVFSTFFLLAISYLTNLIFAKVFNADSKPDSVYISALILALIIPPLKTPGDFWFLFWAAVWTMASKYIFTIRHKHIFNPVAIAVVITSLFIGQSATWWVGTLPMLPFVIAGGVLIIKKMHRFDLIYYFITVALVTIFVASAYQDRDVLTAVKQSILYSSLFFFAFAMLTEPMTSPVTKGAQIWYGAITGFLFAPQIHLGTLYMTPELALVFGNVYAFLANPRSGLLTWFRPKIQDNQIL